MCMFLQKGKLLLDWIRGLTAAATTSSAVQSMRKDSHRYDNEYEKRG